MQIVMSQIPEYFYGPCGITLYRDGAKTQYIPAKPQFLKVIEGFKRMMEGAIKMPAFGVSLNCETLNALKSGVWAEFDYGTPRSLDGMGFTKLLFEVCPHYTGFNIIRYTPQKGYDGRCFYFDLAGDMQNFYNLIKSI